MEVGLLFLVLLRFRWRRGDDRKPRLVLFSIARCRICCRRLPADADVAGCRYSLLAAAAGHVEGRLSTAAGGHRPSWFVTRQVRRRTEKWFLAAAGSGAGVCTVPAIGICAIFYAGRNDPLLCGAWTAAGGQQRLQDVRRSGGAGDSGVAIGVVRQRLPRTLVTGIALLEEGVTQAGFLMARNLPLCWRDRPPSSWFCRPSAGCSRPARTVPGIVLFIVMRRARRAWMDGQLRAARADQAWRQICPLLLIWRCHWRPACSGCLSVHGARILAGPSLAAALDCRRNGTRRLEPGGLNMADIRGTWTRDTKVVPA